MLNSKLNRSVASLVIVWALILQIAVGYPIVALANGPTDTTTTTNGSSNDVVSQLPDSGNGVAGVNGSLGGFLEQLETPTTDGSIPRAPIPVDPGFLTHTQTHIIYRAERQADGSFKDVVDRTVVLNGIEVNNPPVTILDATQELKFRFEVKDDGSKTFIIDRYVADDKHPGGKRLTDSHTIENVDFTGDLAQLERDLNARNEQGNLVGVNHGAANDSVYLLFPSASGVRAASWSDIMETAFKAAVYVPVVLNTTVSGARVERAVFLSRTQAPREHINQTGGVHEAGDISITLSVEGAAIGQGQNSSYPASPQRERNIVHEKVTYLEFKTQFILREIAELALMIVVNPNLRDNADVMEKFQKYTTLYPEEMAQIMAAFDGVVGASEQREGNDLARHAIIGALRNKSQRVDFAAALATINQREALATGIRDIFSADASPNGEWATEQSAFAEALKNRSDLKDAVTWQQAWTLNVKPQTLAALDQTELAKRNIFGRFLNRAHGFYKKTATVENRRVLVKTLAVAGGLVSANVLTDGALGAWAVSTLSHFLAWSSKIPIVNIITGPLNDSKSYFPGLMTSATARWAGGLAIVAAFCPFSLYVAKGVATLQGKTWSAVQAFFSYGTRLAAAMNYPFQKVILDLARNPNPYVAMDAGMEVPPSEAFNWPWASDTTIAQRRNLLNVRIEQDAIKKQAAEIFAAALVSEQSAQDGKGIDIATLLMTAHGKPLNARLDMLSQVKDYNEWQNITAMAYRALVKLGDKGLPQYTPADDAVVAAYVKAYETVKNDIQAARPADPNAPLNKKLNGLYAGAKTFMSRDLPLFLLGKRNYDFYQLYRNATVTAENAVIAKRQYIPDYLATALLYALQRAQKFGEVLRFTRPGIEVLANQASQPLGYAASTGVDVASTSRTDSLPNAHAPLANTLYEGQRVREQTFREGASTIASHLLDPNSRSMFADQGQFMKNIINNFQGRWIVGAPFRALGLFLADYLVTGHWSSLPTAALHAGIFEAVWLLSKQANGLYSWGVTSPHIVVGYAQIWAWGTNNTQAMAEVVKNNDIAIRDALALLEIGTRESIIKADPERAKAARLNGISRMTALFERGNMTLPDQLKVDPRTLTNEVSIQVGRELRDMVILGGKVPLPTVRSNFIETFVINLVGITVFTTSLFDTMSTILYDQHSDPYKILAQALGWLGVNYVVIGKIVPQVTRGILQAIRPTVDRMAGPTNRFLDRVGAAWDRVGALTRRPREAINRGMDRVLSRIAPVPVELAARAADCERALTNKQN